MRQIPKFFNTAGPIQPDIHYNVEPLSRIDLEEIEQLIYQRKYFTIHAPRQSGKTSCLLALRDYLNARGEFIAVYANVEAGQAMRNQINEVMKAIIETIAAEAHFVLKSELPNDVLRKVVWEENVTGSNMLTTFLTELCEALD
ncbi:MAG: ATP-binding protein, partial [Bacteroides sp.]